MNNFVDLRTNLKLQCSNILVAICDLLGTLISSDACGKDTSFVDKEKNVVTSLRERISEQVFPLSSVCKHIKRYNGVILLGLETRAEQSKMHELKLSAWSCCS